MMSLRRSVLVWATVFIAIIAIATVIATRHVTILEVNKLLDNELQQIAINAGQGLSEAAYAALKRTEIENRVAVQVWTDGGELIHKSPGTDTLPRMSNIGFSDVEVGGNLWRVYTGSDGHRFAQVAQRQSARMEIANHAAAAAAVPLLAALPIAWIAAIFGLGRLIQRVAGFAGALAVRGVESSEPVLASEMPREFMPVVGAINGLIERHQFAIEQQRQFVSEAAHELRTPLAALQIQVDNLRNQPNAESVGELSDGIRRATAMVAQLLRLARLDAPHAPGETVEIDLKDLLLSIISDFVPLSTRNGVDLAVATTESVVGPGTPMGGLMREFWIPACLPDELKPDGAPLRIKLLGEKLLAFRDSNGRIGVLDHRCPHRCASLFFGRNEHGGLRCAYHGWKYDVDGNCLDMPNLPADAQFAPRVKAKAYRAAEYGGLVWAYMGNKEQAPPLPALEPLTVSDSERAMVYHMRECNWLQSLEGDIDTSHFGFLHAGSVEPDDVDPDSMHRWGLIDRAPRYHVRETDWGTMYAAYRPAKPGELYYRFAHFLFPFIALVPDGSFNNMVQATLAVPLDDNHTMVYNLSWMKRDPALRLLKDGSPIPGAAVNLKRVPNTTDWLGRWRLETNKANDYQIDRGQQSAGESYSGIPGITEQDLAMVESMDGDEVGIVDRSLEHLAQSDRMISTTRRRLIAAAKDYRDHGAVPTLANQPDLARGARGGSFVAKDNLDWREAYSEQLRVATSPANFLVAAE